MPDELVIVVEPGGVLRFIYDDALAECLEEGASSVTRASDVEPVKRGAHDYWQADMARVSGPRLGLHERRADALAEEVAWLKANRL